MVNPQSPLGSGRFGTPAAVGRPLRSLGRPGLGSSVALVFICGLLLASSGSAAIYKWVDEQGKAHYGDCPPPECPSQEIQVAPPPSDKALEEAQDRLERSRDSVHQGSDISEQNTPAQDLAPAGRRAALSGADLGCFTPLEEGWGGRIPDSRDEVPRTPLGDAQLRAIRDLFRALEGDRGASMQETRCLSPAATPPERLYRHRADLDARWTSDEVFRIEADLVGLDDRSVQREVFWFLLNPGGLRFKRDASGWSFKLDLPGNDVGLVSVEDDLLTFFGREGGSQRKTKVLFLERGDGGVTLRDFFYTNGILTGKRVWEVGR